MYVGAGLWSCGDAPSTAEIWGSDSRLVFLRHNQFAVWIPLHITLNTHSPLDPAKSLSSFLPLPISLHVFFTGLHLCFTFKNLRCPISITVNNSHMKRSRIHFHYFFFSTNFSKTSISLVFYSKYVSFPNSHGRFCTHCIFGQCGGLTRGVIISGSVCV